MTTGDFPQFAASNYASTTHGLDSLMSGQAGGTGMGTLFQTVTTDNTSDLRGRQNIGQIMGGLKQDLQDRQERIVMANQVKRRLVKVIVVDPNENIPLDQCVLFSGHEKLTDLNDQELFFELDIKDLLAKHNDRRIKVIDKKVKERTEYLEPAKIRDLKMVVVNIAEF